jgi:hypothetical protein
VARKNLFQIAVAIALIIGVPLALFVVAVYHAISPRVWAIAMIAWFAAMLLWAIVRKVAAKNAASSIASELAIDERSRRHISREIWVRKIWIGVLVVLFPVGVVNGATHRAWLPTSAGAVISLLWIYVTARQIGQRRRRLDGSLRGT